ncbi:MAG TPA: hypothetical protein VL221_06265 [Bacteroidota bacterium]|nr:hypothetical protein [Bacteroidota bacterium]
MNEARVLRTAVAVLPAALIALNLLVIPGYTGDDAFIHFTFARNLATHGVFGYNTPYPSYGSTSILWVIVCAGFSLLTGNVVLTGRVLSALLTVGSAALFAGYLSTKLRLPLRGVLAGLAIYLVNAVMFRWMMTGMETGLTLFVAVLILRSWSTAHSLRNALLSLTAFLDRPEFILIPLACAIALSFRRGGKSYQDPGARQTPGTGWNAAAYFAVTAILFACWFMAASLYFHAFLPMTSFKTGSLFDAESLYRFTAVVGGTYPDLLLLAGFLVITGHFSRQVFRGIPPGEALFFVFSVLLLGMYALKGTNMISRYLLIIHPAAALLMVRLLASAGARRWLPRAAIGIGVVQAALFLTLHLEPIRAFVSGFQSVYASMGRELGAAPDTGSVMVADVGIVGYYSGRPIIDTGGLVSIHTREAGTAADTALIARYRPRFVIARRATPGIDSCAASWKASAPALAAVAPLRHERIGRLGTMGREGDAYDVYLLRLSWGE